MKVYCRVLYAFMWYIFIYPTIVQSVSTEYETRSVKKQLNDSAPAIDHLHPESIEHPENKTEQIIEFHNTIARLNNKYDIPDSFRVGFYVFIGLGLLAIFYIIFKSYKLRLSRAERRYGVHGDRSAQELTPLPIAIEEDSDNEDQTLFEINSPARIS